MNTQQQLLRKLNDLPFKEVILNSGGMIYAVGGVLRDSFLNKESKDFDIMVTGVKYDTLLALLETFGKVDLVGESFGIIKFKEFGSTEDIDISLPRTEISTGDRGHKAFDVTTDPDLPIEADLSRRDLTINSMAMDVHGTIIDPFGGLDDLKKGVIAMTNPKTFFDDPLRMLRAVVFASRFNFKINNETLFLIKECATRLKEIAKERILIELEKIVSKGDPQIGAELLIESLLYHQIFGNGGKPQYNFFKNVKTLGEFIYRLYDLKTYRFNDNAYDFYRDVLSGDINTYKEIRALTCLRGYVYYSNIGSMRCVFFDAMKIYPKVIDTEIFHDKFFKLLVNEFKSGKYPSKRSDLAIKGDYLTKFGFQGEQLGVELDKLIRAILHGTVENTELGVDYFFEQINTEP